MNILVTGANGFIGGALVADLLALENHTIRAVIRKSHHSFPASVEVCVNVEITETTDWEAALQDIDVVVHCAARVHEIKDESRDPLSEFRKVNTAGTLNLARQAKFSGVKKFIFLSSLGVNGSLTSTLPFTEDDVAQPHTPYSRSKLEAEIGLLELSQKTTMSVVIIRPPLVYGPRAPGNFRSLLRVVNKRIPLPLGGLSNKRSLVYIGNLTNFIIFCMNHPNANNQVFLVSDDEDVSTTKLLREIGVVLNKPPILIPISAKLLMTAAKIIGKEKVAQQLLGSLQVDLSKAKILLGWRPPYSVEKAFLDMVEQRQSD